MKCTVAGIALLVVQISPASAQSVDLSPGRWPAAVRERLEAREAAIRPAGLRELRGSGGIVSATMSPVAAHAGAEVLRKGGTAADAAIATALTQVTMMAGANVSFAGAAQVLYFDARKIRVYALDAGWNGWSGERQPASIPAADVGMLTGATVASAGAAGRKTLVPGFMAGLEALHDRFGRTRWGALFDPAIWYAERGIPVTPLLAAYFDMARAPLARTAAGKAFLMPSGANPPKIGDRFAPTGLAGTLRAVARNGAKEMYIGDWGRRFVAAVRDQGGAASLADMAAYRPGWTRALTAEFAGGRVHLPDPANPSGCAMAMALNIVAHADAGRRYWQDAAALRTLALVLRMAIAAPYLPQVAALERELGTGAGCQVRAGARFGAAAAERLDTLAGIAPAALGEHHTATVVAVDRWGNVAALVHSSNTLIWGDSGMVVGGVPIPTAAGIYQQRLATIAPGGRLPSDMAPLMLLRGGRPVVAIAGAGTSVVPESVRLMMGFSRGERMADWLAAPPLLLNFEQAGEPLAHQDELIPADAYPPRVLDLLRAMNFRFRTVDGQRVSVLRGTVAAVRLGAGGIREAAEVPEVLAFTEKAE